MMIPVPFTWAAGLVAAAIAVTVVSYEGIPFILAGRVDRAYAGGQQAERQIWEEQRRRDIAAREAERLVAQTKINTIESDYWQKSALQSFEISRLEKALETEPAATGNDCPPAVSRRLRDALNTIGR